MISLRMALRELAYFAWTTLLMAVIFIVAMFAAVVLPILIR